MEKGPYPERGFSLPDKYGSFLGKEKMRINDSNIPSNSICCQKNTKLCCKSQWIEKSLSEQIIVKCLFIILIKEAYFMYWEI